MSSPKQMKIPESIDNLADLILDSVTDGIYVIDTQANVLFWNSAAEKMTGYSIEEFAGGNLHELIHHTNLEAKVVPVTDCPVYHAMHAGASITINHDLFWRKNGTSFPVEYITQPIIQDGEIKGTVLSFRDISERIKAEEMLRSAEKLSMAGQLAAGIAHEIRNPLTSLKGFLQLIRTGMEREVYLEIMNDELNRIELILSELLMLAKPQSMTRRQINFSELVEQVVLLLEAQSAISNVQFLTELQADLPFYCEENQIKQLLINLLKNAVDAMPAGGRIWIEAGLVDGEIVLRIRDEGCGIPAEILEHLGQPFYTTKEKGTGLGMMVSYKIIRNHNGQVHVESESGKGTEFLIRFKVDGELAE